MNAWWSGWLVTRDEHLAALEIKDKQIAAALKSERSMGKRLFGFLRSPFNVQDVVDNPDVIQFSFHLSRTELVQIKSGDASIIRGYVSMGLRQMLHEVRPDLELELLQDSPLTVLDSTGQEIRGG